MNHALNMIAKAAGHIGYRSDAILKNYRFSDFGASHAKEVPLAIFTQTPASYRSAAFGAANEGPDGIEATVRTYTFLGAPVFFVVSKDHTTIWQVYAGGGPRLLETVQTATLEFLFDSRKEIWGPESIHRAKSIGRVEPSYQLDFVDIGLMPAIEGQIHEKLDRLLASALASTETRVDSDSARGMFQGVFRLLAAKILIDRGHAAATTWNAGDVSSILLGIGDYYGLANSFEAVKLATQLEPAWKVLSEGISVANISADDLAFVYENTLVTPATRRAFGTHSTPRHVAEYVVSRLGLWRGGDQPPQVYEPFAGAGIFLVSALRHMREALPHTWSDRQRHDLLVKKIGGSEIDAFACEVATLSLILADYPNKNGWKIENRDLFEEGTLANRLKVADVVLCNPPFEAFDPEQKVRYKEAAAEGGTKAEAVLMLALKARPKALGFVLPRAFLMDRAYREHRRAIEQRFREVELVSLPDGVFQVSKVETALLVARDPVETTERQVLRSSEVDDSDRKRFRLLGIPSRTREVERSTSALSDGAIWITPLDQLWRRLSEFPKLRETFHGHWGIRWLDRRQGNAAFEQPGADRVLGLARAQGHRQFSLARPQWLDVKPEHLYGGGELPWDAPKILCNAARLSRGPWRLAAALDATGLRASQQYVALWAHDNLAPDLDAYTAILNSPLANAFLTDHSADKRLRISTLLSLPVPKEIPATLGDMVRSYRHELSNSLLEPGSDHQLETLLDEIDSLVLEAFDLAPRMIRTLLATFRNVERPLAHPWQPWAVTESDPALTVSELRSSKLIAARRKWPQTLEPVSKAEAAQVAPFLP